MFYSGGILFIFFLNKIISNGFSIYNIECNICNRTVAIFLYRFYNECFTFLLKIYKRKLLHFSFVVCSVLFLNWNAQNANSSMIIVGHRQLLVKITIARFWIYSILCINNFYIVLDIEMIRYWSSGVWSI